MPRNPHEKGAQATTRAVLNVMETLALAEICKARYSASNLNAVEFAATINDTPSERNAFRFPINAGHVRNMLDACGIPIKKDIPRMPGNALGFEVALTELQNRVQSLETRLVAAESALQHHCFAHPR